MGGRSYTSNYPTSLSPANCLLGYIQGVVDYSHGCRYSQDFLHYSLEIMWFYFVRMWLWLCQNVKCDYEMSKWMGRKARATEAKIRVWWYTPAVHNDDFLFNLLRAFSAYTVYAGNHRVRNTDLTMGKKSILTTQSVCPKVWRYRTQLSTVWFFISTFQNPLLLRALLLPWLLF